MSCFIVVELSRSELPLGWPKEFIKENDWLISSDLRIVFLAAAEILFLCQTAET